MNEDISRLRDAKAGRCASWDKTGRNSDCWWMEPGETRVLADIEGQGTITHIWMTQEEHYRECLLKFTWDNAAHPSVLVPLGDFFCLGHGIVNSFQSQLFTASANKDCENRFGGGCALNCYAPMPFRERARVELINQSQEVHRLWYYVDYERYDEPRAGAGYFHAEFRRANPFGGWGHEIRVNRPETFAANKGRTAWENNYVILETNGSGPELVGNDGLSIPESRKF